MGVLVSRVPTSEEVTREAIQTALTLEPPVSEEQFAAAVDALTSKAATGGRGLEINSVNFVAAVTLFLLLVTIAIVVDWKNVVSDPSVYTGMATPVLGVIVGFLGGEASGSTS